MNSLMENSTWELVDLPKDRIAIGCKWVFKLKTNVDGSIQRFKARLVAQGYSQKYGSDYDEVFAPVVKQTTFRVLMSVAAKERMIVKHLDAKTAFLNGKLRETIYMKQPPGFELKGQESKVCLLKKSIYGLKQAARAWNEAIHNVLVEHGFKQSKIDLCLYSKCVNGVWCYVLIYVDDLPVASKSENLIQEVENILAEKFEISNLGHIKQFLRMEVTKDVDGNYVLGQSNYIENIIMDLDLSDAKPAKTPMDANYGKLQQQPSKPLGEKGKYRRFIGCLLYVAINTRPDISASVSILSQKLENPTETDWNQLKRVVRYLKGTMNMKLRLSNIKGNPDVIVGYADADYAEDRITRKSNSGMVFFVNGGVCSWACRKQTCVSLSSTEAEFISLSSACQEASWLRRLLEEFNQPIKSPITMNEDNQSCLKIIKEEYMSNSTKHIDTRVYFVKDYVVNGIVSCVYCPTNEMIADLLSKPLQTVKHNYFRKLCRVE